MIIQQLLITTICVNRFHQSRTGRLSKNTAHVLCNRSISCTNGQLMGLFLHKGPSTNSDHYISMVKVGDIWFECDDVKITKIEFNHFCNSNIVYMLFNMLETFKGHWACPNGCRLLSELMRRHRNYILNMFLLKTSFHALLTFIYFCYLFDSLAFVACCF